MNTKAKGEISEGVVVAELLKIGRVVLIPFGNNQRYDLVYDDGTRLVKAQVKTGQLQNGRVIFRSCSTNGFTGERRDYKGQIDVFLVYCEQTGKVYEVPVADVGRSTVSLRVDPPKTGLKRPTLRDAEQYILR